MTTEVKQLEERRVKEKRRGEGRGKEKRRGERRREEGRVKLIIGVVALPPLPSCHMANRDSSSSPVETSINTHILYREHRNKKISPDQS